MIDLAWLFFTILLFACIPLSGWIAERRGRSIKLWCWMGFIFGPIAPLVVALLPPASEPGGHPPAVLGGSGLWRRDARASLWRARRGPQPHYHGMCHAIVAKLGPTRAGSSNRPDFSGQKPVYCLRSPSTVAAMLRMSSYSFSSRRAFRCIAARPPIDP
jgi:hypothetical protein